jgi:Family of unknown function (DUF6504)
MGGGRNDRVPGLQSVARGGLGFAEGITATHTVGYGLRWLTKIIWKREALVE